MVRFFIQIEDKEIIHAPKSTCPLWLMFTLPDLKKSRAAPDLIRIVLLGSDSGSLSSDFKWVRTFVARHVQL